MQDERVPLTVIFPVRNEEDNLKKSLPSVAWADQIFVVDSASDDGTATVADRYKAEVVQFSFNGTWPKKKNWALDNLPIRNDWVLLLDADEVLTGGAREEISRITRENPGGFDGYFINRRFIFMGKRLRHSYYPNRVLRMFKHRLGRFEKITDLPTGSGDVEIHEHIILSGKAGVMSASLDHFAFPTIESFVEKHDRYSNWEATIEARSDKEISFSDLGSLKSNMLRLLKKTSKKVPFRPFLRFVYVFFFQGGFLDGREGYYFARLHAFYEFLCCCKAYEMRENLKKNGRSAACGGPAT